VYASPVSLLRLPPPRRRETYNRYRQSIHMYCMLNFTYEDDLKIKNKHVAGVSRTFYLSTETISSSPISWDYPFKENMFTGGKVQLCLYSQWHVEFWSTSLHAPKASSNFWNSSLHTPKASSNFWSASLHTPMASSNFWSTSLYRQVKIFGVLLYILPRQATL
jgi:hypothetical protein